MKDASRKGKKTKRLVPFVVSTSLMTAALFGTAGTSAFASDQTQEPKFKNHGAKVSFYAKTIPGSPEKGKLMRAIAHGDVQVGLPDAPGLPESPVDPGDVEQPGDDMGQPPVDIANPAEGSDTGQAPGDGDILNPDDDGNTGTLPGDIEEPGNGDGTISDDGSVPGNEAGTNINIGVTVE